MRFLELQVASAGFVENAEHRMFHIVIKKH